jgi:hypothetical protein
VPSAGGRRDSGGRRVSTLGEFGLCFPTHLSLSIPGDHGHDRPLETESTTAYTPCIFLIMPPLLAFITAFSSHGRYLSSDTWLPQALILSLEIA